MLKLELGEGGILCFQTNLTGRTWDLEKKGTPKAFRAHLNLPA